MFRIDGMCCGEEATILQRRLRPIAGVEDVAADIVGQRLHVKYDAAVVSTNAIVEAVAETGMRAWLEHEQPVASAVRSQCAGLLVLASAIALVTGFVLTLLDVPAIWRICHVPVGGRYGRRVSRPARVGFAPHARARHQRADAGGGRGSRLSGRMGRSRDGGVPVRASRSGSSRAAWIARAKPFAR